MTSNDSCAGIYVRCDPPDRRTHRVLTAGAHARALKPSFSNLARPNRGYIATRVRRAPPGATEKIGPPRDHDPEHAPGFEFSNIIRGPYPQREGPTL